jgi:hypothetical protein
MNTKDIQKERLTDTLQVQAVGNGSSFGSKGTGEMEELLCLWCFYSQLITKLYRIFML